MKHSTPTFYSGEVRLIGLAFTQKLPMSWQAPNCRIRSDACHELLQLFERPLCRLSLRNNRLIRLTRGRVAWGT